MKTLLALLASASLLLAEGPQLPETITVDEVTYTGCVYQAHDAVNLMIRHADGAATLRLAKLPADLQALLKYDPATSKAAQEAARKARMLAAERARKASIGASGEPAPQMLVIEPAVKDEAVTLPRTIPTKKETYMNCLYQKHNKAYVFVSHSDGLSRIRIADLPEEIQATLGYDEASAAEYEKATKYNESVAAFVTQQNEANRIASQEFRQRVEKESREFNIEVIQVLPSGVLADYYVETGASNVSSSARLGMGGGGGFASYALTGKTYFFSGVKGMAEGQKKALIAIPDGVYKYEDVYGASRTVEKWRYVRDQK